MTKYKRIERQQKANYRIRLRISVSTDRLIVINSKVCFAWHPLEAVKMGLQPFRASHRVQDQNIARIQVLQTRAV